MLAPPTLLRLVGAALVACLVTQAVLGWLLGVTDAWVTVTIACGLLGALVTADSRVASRDDAEAEAEAEGYDPVVCLVVAIAVLVAIACLYLPLPWGGLAAGFVVAGLLIALILSRHRSSADRGPPTQRSAGGR